MTLHFLFLCCLPGIFAQDSDSRFINISGQLGMLHASINDIYQDKSGFLWLATSVGLYRYDGYMFKAYRHDVLDSTSLSSPQVWSVTGDAHDRIVV